MASKDFNKLLKQTEAKRNLMTKQMKKEIRSLYRNIYKDYEKKLLKANQGTLNEKFLYNAKKELEAEIRRLNDEVYKTTKSHIESITSELTNSQLDIWLSIDDKYSLGLEKQFRSMFSKINQDAIAEILSGSLYKDRLGLSERLWIDGKLMGSDVKNIIAEGIGKKESTYDIAKKLERYLNPNMSSHTIYQASKKKIEFNSYRLAHTAISHAYQQVVRRSAKKNPFVEGIRWRSVLQARTCQLCKDRHDKLFSPDSNGPYPVLENDHPLGICSHLYEITQSYEEIGTELNDWVNGKSNTKLDEWFKEYGIDFI